MKTNRLLTRTSTLLFALLMFLAVGWSNSVHASEPFNCGSAKVWTDKDDYAPGEVALISGSGWMPGETVDLQLFSTNLQAYEYFEVVADMNGEFTGLYYDILEIHLGEEFVLDALGMTSGCTAVWYFTDGRAEISDVSPSPFSPNQPSSLGVNDVLTITAWNNGQGNINNFAIRIRQGNGVTGTIFFETSQFQLQSNQTTTRTWDGTRNINGTGFVPDGPYTVIALSGGGGNPKQTEDAGTFRVVIVDNTNPVIVLPSNRTVNNDHGVCGAIINWTIPTVTDANPDPNGLKQIAGPSNGSSFPIGTTTITYEATDLAGNKSTASFTVTVTDNEKPVLTLPTIAESYSADKGVCHAALSFTATATDNCNLRAIVYSVGGNVITFPYNFPVGKTTVDVLATDIHGNTNNGKFDVIVIDNEKPVISGMPAAFAVNNDAGECSAVVTWTAPTAADNCEVESFTSNFASGYAFPVGTTTVIYTAEDIHGNIETASFNVVVTDNEKPTITSPANITVSTDKGKCYATITDLGEPETDDNCGVDSVSNNFADLFTDGQVSFGVHQITWTVVDIHGNENTSEQTITVNEVTTVTSVTVTPSSRQYSDQVTFTASIAPYECNGANAATSVTFKVGNQEVGTANLSNGGTATLSAALLETIAGSMAPGQKTVTAVFNGVNENFNVVDPTADLTITREDAILTYVGDRLIATTGNANLNLRVVIEDSSLAKTTDAIYDNNPGEINQATVTFMIYEGTTHIATVSDVTLSLLDGNKQRAVASATWPVSLVTGSRTFYIQVVANGYYIGSIQDVLAVVYIPSGDHVTGGGFIVPSISAGTYPAAAGTHANFGFNFRYQQNRNRFELQGNLNLVYRNASGTFQFNSTEALSLGVNTNIRTAATATFTVRGTLRLANGSTISGLLLHGTLTDRGNPGSNDDIGFTIWNGNELVFSSHWDGNSTDRIRLSGGNLVVHSGADRGDIPLAIAQPGGQANAVAIPIEIENELRVFPNPFRDRLNFRFAPTKDTQVRLELFDLTGALVEVVFEGAVAENQLVEVHYTPRLNNSTFLFYRLTMGNDVQTGKVMYQK